MHLGALVRVVLEIQFSGLSGSRPERRQRGFKNVRFFGVEISQRGKETGHPDLVRYADLTLALTRIVGPIAIFPG